MSPCQKTTAPETSPQSSCPRKQKRKNVAPLRLRRGSAVAPPRIRGGGSFPAVCPYGAHFATMFGTLRIC
eukprot:11198944-Lingulodinium_polyedra.AAC.1